MYRGLNILEFYIGSKESHWHTTGNKDNCVMFYKGVMPPFVLYYEGTILYQSTLHMKNAETELTIETATPTVLLDITGWYRILFNWKNAAVTPPIGFYYYELEYNNGDKLYSDVFGYISATDSTGAKMVRLSIESNNVTFAGVHNMPVLFTTSFVALFNLNGSNVLGEIIEDGVEKPYGNIPVFSTLSLKYNIEINVYRSLLKFLYALRIFSINGTVLIGYKNGSSIPVYDLQVEIKDDYDFGDMIVVNLTFKEQSFLSTRNAI